MSAALEEAKRRGLVAAVTDEEGLSGKLRSEKVRVYAGFDPTANSLHVGHLAPIMLLRLLKRHGHEIYPLVGGGTALIGDPSGRDAQRPMVDAEEVSASTERVRSQLRALTEEMPENNAHWLQGQSLIEFLRDVGGRFSASDLLRQETFKRRLDAGEALSFLEMAYPLIQAMDFLVMRRGAACSLQVGGSDQWANICAGIDLVRRVDGVRVYGATCPLLTDSNGRKIGKTSGGRAVWLDRDLTDDHAFFQHWRDVPDADVEKFLLAFTELPVDEAVELASRTGAALNPVKERLAFEVTSFVRGVEAAKSAMATARAAFGHGRDDSALPEVGVIAGEALSLPDALLRGGLVATKSEARRHVAQAAVRIDGERATSPDVEVAPESGEKVRLSVGKKRHVVLVGE